MFIFKFLSHWDWLSPFGAILDDTMHLSEGMDVWTFFLPFDEMTQRGWSTYDVRLVLSQHGIECWGGLVFDDEFMFKVKLKQARWAEYILNRHGIPVADKCVEPPAPYKEDVTIDGSSKRLDSGILESGYEGELTQGLSVVLNWLLGEDDEASG